MLAHMTAKNTGRRRATKEQKGVIADKLMQHVGTDKFKGTMLKLSEELELSPEEISRVVRNHRKALLIH